MSISQRPGQTLLEMVIAIAVITVSTLATTTLIVVTITTGRVSQAQIQAANLAREGVEIVRAIRDSNWLKADQNVIDATTGTTVTWDASGVATYPTLVQLCGSGQGCTGLFVPGAGWRLCRIGTALCLSNQVNLYSSSGSISRNRCPSGQTCFYSQSSSCLAANCQKSIFTRNIVITTAAETWSGQNLEVMTVTSTVTAPGSLRNPIVATEKLYNWR